MEKPTRYPDFVVYLFDRKIHEFWITERLMRKNWHASTSKDSEYWDVYIWDKANPVGEMHRGYYHLTPTSPAWELYLRWRKRTEQEIEDILLK